MKTETPEAPAASILTRKQTRFFRADVLEDGHPVVVIATVRYDDQCGNGHNTFSITGEVYRHHIQRGEPKVAYKNGGRTLWLAECGQTCEMIEAHIPELRPFMKWHLTDSTGPMHYIENTVYHAGDRDHYGLRKGERRQIINGRTKVPCWELVGVWPDGSRKDGPLDPHETKDCLEQDLPPPPVMEWRPWCTVGEGKARELDHARSSAVWPDATDAELSQEPDALRAQLKARHPALMAEFRAAVESLGFTF